MNPGVSRADTSEADLNPSVLSEIIDPTTFTGDVRIYDFRRWHDQNQPYETQPDLSYDSQGTAVGGDFKLKTGEWKGFSAGIGLFTQHSVIDYSSPNKGLYVDPDVTQIAEGYLRYQTQQTRFTFGRQLMNTPFANSDMYTMLTRAFQGISGSFDLLGSEDPVRDNQQLTKDVLAPFIYKSHPAPANIKLFVVRMTKYQSRYSSDFTAANRYSPNIHTVDLAVPIDTPGLSATGIEYQQNVDLGDILARAWGYNFFDYAKLQFLETGFQAAPLGGVRPYLRASYVHETESGAAYLGRVHANYLAVKVGLNLPAGSVALIAAEAPRDVGSFRNGALAHPYNDLSDVLYDDTMMSGLENLGPGRALGVAVEYKPNASISLIGRYMHYIADYGTNGAVYSYNGPFFFSAAGLVNSQLVPDQRSYACDLSATWKLGSISSYLKGLSINQDLGVRGGYGGASKFVDSRLRLVYGF